MRRLCSVFWAVLMLQFSCMNFSHADDNWLKGERARLQTLDKITARISTLDVPIGLTTRFGTLELYVHSCNYRPPDHPPTMPLCWKSVPLIMMGGSWKCRSFPAGCLHHHQPSAGWNIRFMTLPCYHVIADQA